VANEIQVYGAGWCGLTFRIREYLMNARMTYDFFDIDRDPQAHEIVLAMTDGRLRFPVIVIDHHVLTDPTMTELQRVLEAHAIRPTRRSSPRAPA
jgi:glutaredoxin